MALTGLARGGFGLIRAIPTRRAQRAYARAGFTLEGRLRMHDHCAPLDRNFDTLLYGILRAEWAAGRG